MGIEPTSKAWEAFILPLNYTRKTPYKKLLKNFAESRILKNKGIRERGTRKRCKIPLRH